MNEQETILYETRGEVTEQVMLASIRASLMPKYLKATFTVSGIILIICAAVLVYIGAQTGNWDNLPIVAGLCLGLPVCVAVLRRSVIRPTLARFREEARDGKQLFVSGFTDTCAMARNESTGGQSQIEYQHFARLMNAGGVWLLVTKSRLMLPIFPGTLSDTDRESLLNMLKEKCPKLKIEV